MQSVASLMSMDRICDIGNLDDVDDDDAMATEEEGGRRESSAVQGGGGGQNTSASISRLVSQFDIFTEKENKRNGDREKGEEVKNSGKCHGSSLS